MTIRIVNAQNKRCIEVFSLENQSLDSFMTWSTKWNLSPKQMQAIFKINETEPTKVIEVALKGDVDWSPLGA